MGPPPATLLEARRPRVGLRVDYRTGERGVVEVTPQADHRLSVHAGPPIRSVCHNHRFQTTRGDVDIVPAGTSASWTEDEPGTSLVLWMPPALLRQAAQDMGLDPARAGLEPKYLVRDPRIEHIAWALEAEQQAGFPNGRLYTDSLGMALAAHLLSSYSAPVEVRQGLSKVQLRRLTDYIEDHLDQDLSLEKLALVAQVSASHLKTLFKRSMGLPVHAYVIQRRVERAKALLVSGQRSVGEVALEAGFSHQSHLARCMRRVLGVTPMSLVRAARER